MRMLMVMVVMVRVMMMQAGTSWGGSSKPDLFLNFILIKSAYIEILGTFATRMP